MGIEEDAIVLARFIREKAQPVLEDGWDEPKFFRCECCDADHVPYRWDTGETKEDQRRTFKHEANCPYVLAGDMLTGY